LTRSRAAGNLISIGIPSNRFRIIFVDCHVE